MLFVVVVAVTVGVVVVLLLLLFVVACATKHTHSKKTLTNTITVSLPAWFLVSNAGNDSCATLRAWLADCLLAALKAAHVHKKKINTKQYI